jgi:hypothetical protein
MKVFRTSTAAVAVATAVTAVVTAVGAPSYAAGRQTCTPFNQGGWNGDVCVSYVGFGDGEFIGTAHAVSYPSDCASFRIDLVDPYSSLVKTTGNLPCRTGTIGSVEFPAIAFVKERAQAHLLSFDSAGNTLLSVETDILASPFAPPVN